MVTIYHSKVKASVMVLVYHRRAMRMIELGYDLEVLRFYYTDVHLIDMKEETFT